MSSYNAQFSKQDQGAGDSKEAASGENKEELFQRLGQLTRMLRDNMRDLGLQKDVQEATETMPNARERLNYVASMTEQAADRVLNAIDRARPLQQEVSTGAKTLHEQWSQWLENPDDPEQTRVLGEQTQVYLADVQEKTRTIDAEMLEITMAQDFQDLTGQVIKKMMTVVHDVEYQLLDILVDSARNEDNRDQLRQQVSDEFGDEQGSELTSLLNGPQTDPDAGGIATSQEQVDDLLDDLGF